MKAEDKIEGAFGAKLFEPFFDKCIRVVPCGTYVFLSYGDSTRKIEKLIWVDAERWLHARPNDRAKPAITVARR